MTKRFAKMKKSKRGSLLVMVVLILALAIIFISSAMMLTQATKGRLYDNAMSSQARLTVTAASEAFLEALETQEITDDQFDRMLLGPDLNAPKVGQHAMGDRIKMVISGVPGMGGVDGNCTYLDLYYPDASNLSVVHADFTTVIGDETENVQIRLIIDDKEDSNAGSGFSNQVEINSSVGVSQLRFSSGVGMYDGDKYPAGSPRDNTIFCRDNFFENESSNSLFFSDIVVGGDDDGTVFCFGSNTGVYGDMIFLDDAYLSCHASNSYGIHGDLYFLADPHDDMADDDTSFKLFKDGGWSDIANDIKIVFSGRRVQDSTDVWTHGSDGAESDNGKIAALFTGSNSDRAFFVDKSGKSLAVASVGATKKNGGTYTVKNTQLNSDNNKSNTGSYNSEGGGSAYSVTDKVNYYQNTYKANTGTFPTAASVFDEVVMDVKTAPSGGLNNIKFVARSADKTKTYNKGDNIPAGTKYYIPLTETYPFESTDSAHYKTLTLPTNASAGGSTTLAPGYYLITGSATTASTRSSGTKPYVYYIDGSKAEEYRFWFQGGKTFNLNCVVFALYNVSDETAKHSTIFILEEGAQVWLGGQNTNCDLAGADSDVFCTSGFLSMPRGSKAQTDAVIGGHANGESVTHVKKPASGDQAATVWKYPNGNELKYCSYYDGINRPAIFIYGVKNNTFRISYGTVLEAYIGIYDGGSFGVREGTSNDVSKIIPIYGRIESSSFKNGSSGNQPLGNILMPYCPQPAKDPKNNPIRPAVSKYHVTDVIYYYDNPADAVDE